MNTQDEWLERMMDAALTDPPESLNEPDFISVRRASSKSGYFPALQNRRRLISAAAAVLVISLAVPAGVTVLRRAAVRQQTQEQSDLFVEQLIHGSLFDEKLVPDESWIFDESSDTGSILPFDI